MKRRDFLASSAALTWSVSILAEARPPVLPQQDGPQNPLPVPNEPIKVAFVISRGATVIDFAGPWEVFQDVAVPGRNRPFELYTVSEEKGPIECTAGLDVMPDYDLKGAPDPHVVVIPAQGGARDATLAWLRRQNQRADVIMSVCTGAFILARAGLLDGLPATTHHDFYDRLAARFPEVEVRKGLRFVEGKKISTAGGLTSGVDLALRVVERYFGRQVAQQTADYMEYQSTGWIL